MRCSAHAAPLTGDNGAPVGNNQNLQTAGPNGPTLLQDRSCCRSCSVSVASASPSASCTPVVPVPMASSPPLKTSPTRTPPRFEKGSTTPVFVRFSTVVHGLHSPETLRDPRGFATKFYTADGNWDLVGNNFPTFFIRDAVKFPDMVHPSAGPAHQPG